MGICHSSHSIAGDMASEVGEDKDHYRGPNGIVLTTDRLNETVVEPLREGRVPDYNKCTCDSMNCVVAVSIWLFCWAWVSGLTPD